MIVEGRLNMVYYTYMLRCKDETIYAGITTDVERRFKEHTQKTEKGAKYTKSHDVVKIEAVWKSENRMTASKLEYWIKHLTKRQKERLIEENCLDILKDKIEKEKYERVDFSQNDIDK